MKNILCLVLVAFFAIQSHAQFDLSFDPKEPGVEDCFNCFYPGYGSHEYSTGTKWGLSFGLVKNISQRFDLTTQISYQYWQYKIRTVSDYYGSLEPFTENNHVASLAIGQRFHWVQFKNASIYAATYLNFQAYFKQFHKNLGLSIEPAIGWKQAMGEKSEFFMELSYDQHLTSYDETIKRLPGSVGINMGFNLVLKKKVQENLDLTK